MTRSAIMSVNIGQMMGLKESFTKSKTSTMLHSNLEQDFTQYEDFSGHWLAYICNHCNERLLSWITNGRHAASTLFYTDDFLG